MFHRTVARAAAVGLALVSAAAAADTATGSFLVSTTVLKSCTVAPTPLAFASYSPSGDVDGTSTIAVLCTLNTPYKIALDKGANGAAVTTRKMKLTTGADTLNYSLFSDSNRSANWGETLGTDTVDATGTGLLVTHTVYGRIAASQTTSPAGIYNDTIQVTVNY
ncbi:MAG TPA: spore coat U domain-containing protein [Solimonas sp.]|nr:spore coat U domain-containing protein [Solimonas sp.]